MNFKVTNRLVREGDIVAEVAVQLLEDRTSWSPYRSLEAAVIERRGHGDMALIPADELASLRETAYLLRSPKNAARLLAALARARRGRTPA